MYMCMYLVLHVCKALIDMLCKNCLVYLCVPDLSVEELVNCLIVFFSIYLIRHIQMYIIKFSWCGCAINANALDHCMGS